MKVRKISEKVRELLSTRCIRSSACAVCPAVHSDPNIPGLCFPLLYLAIRWLIFLFMHALLHNVPVQWFWSYREPAGGRKLQTAENFKTRWTKLYQLRSQWVWEQPRTMYQRVCCEARLLGYLHSHKTSAGGGNRWVLVLKSSAKSFLKVWGILKMYYGRASVSILMEKQSVFSF